MGITNTAGSQSDKKFGKYKNFLVKTLSSCAIIRLTFLEGKTEMEGNLTEFLLQFIALATAGGFGYCIYKMNNDTSKDREVE